MALDHDGIFKQLLSTFLVEFLELFASEVLALIEPDSLILLATDSFVDLLDPDRRTADLVVQARMQGDPATILIHLEHQAQEDRQIDRRMFRYFARFYDRYDCPIYPLALCSYPSPRRAAPAHHRVAIGTTPVLAFQYQVVQLNQLDWRMYLSSANPLAVALMARMRITPGERWRVKAACLRQLAGLPLTGAQRRMLATFVSIYLPLNARETTLFQAEAASWQVTTREAVVEFISEWELKGRVEGRVEERQELILRQLSRKLGPLPESVQAQVLALAPDVLLELSDALLDFGDLADLTAWLAQHSLSPR
jgi:predicted transposase YdaD